MDNFSSVNIHVLEVNVASVNVNVYVGFFWRGGMCMYWGVNVVSEHVDVYVISGVNVASVHFHVYVYVLGKSCQYCLCSSPCVREGGSMLPLFMFMCRGQCCLCLCTCVCVGVSMLPLFLSMC